MAIPCREHTTAGETKKSFWKKLKVCSSQSCLSKILFLKVLFSWPFRGAQKLLTWPLRNLQGEKKSLSLFFLQNGSCNTGNTLLTINQSPEDWGKLLNNSSKWINSIPVATQCSLSKCFSLLNQLNINIDNCQCMPVTPKVQHTINQLW